MPEIERSRILGDYYRDLSANYMDYSEGLMPWPSRPFGFSNPNLD